MDYEQAKARYVELVATVGEASLKGAKMPYTSMNGNMYSYLGENGVALRLPADAREQFLAKTDDLAPYFRVSFDYAKTLRPKPTKRAPKS